MRYPEGRLVGNEQVLHQFRPHWKVLIPAIAWALGFAALVGVGFAALDLQNAYWVLAGVVVVWLALSAKSILAWVFTNYVLTSGRIIVRKGMVARSGTEIPLESISNVLFSQRVLERLLGYGDVIVESAGSMGQVDLVGVPDPERLQHEIRKAREVRIRPLSGRGRQHADPSQVRDVVGQLEVLADLCERGHLTHEEFTAQKRLLIAA
jgi:uncharacterized membrane protein YdbT with pleckstrin-like domain